MNLGTKSQKFESFISDKIVEEDPDEFSERLRKTWYYGRVPGTDRPSLAVTDLMVDFYNEAAPRELGKLDTYLAASTSRSACISPSSVMAGMMYVKRLKKRRPDYLTQVSSSELFLISMMMASKFLYDEGVDDEVFNDEWAASGDLETEDVNQLELDFLQAMDWQLFVRQEEFADMLDQIEKRVALQQGMKRGWFTYTDMMVLSRDLKLMNWNGLITELSTVFSVGSLAYLAGILTLVGSTMLGTATSSAVMKAGSVVLPAGFNLLPILTLTSDLQSEVILSRSTIFGKEQENVHGNQSMEHKPGNKGQQEITETSQQESHLSGQEPVPDDLEGRFNTKIPVKEHVGLLNGFLSPFLALLTLKDTFFQFVSGAAVLMDDDRNSDLPEFEPLDTTFEEDGTEQEFCSFGPCQIDSWPNCWNVTGQYSWTAYGNKESGSAENIHGQTRNEGLLQTRERGVNHCPRCRHGNSDARCRGVPRVCRKTYCCCRVGRTERPMARSLYRQAMVDINLRFATRSVAPVFVTT